MRITASVGSLMAALETRASYASSFAGASRPTIAICAGAKIAFHIDVSGRLVDLAQAFDQCRLSVSARRL